MHAGYGWICEMSYAHAVRTRRVGAVGHSRSALIVGGGIIGVTSAYALARDGWHVRILDSCGRDTQGCSKGNGRL